MTDDGSRRVDPLWAAGTAARPAVNALLGAINRWLMIPALRRGLGAWVGTPIGGYVLLLRTLGRRTGRTREAPLSYLVRDGSAWVLAGFGPRTAWYRNLVADPDVEVVLPRGRARARAQEVADGPTRARVIPELVRATGLPGLLVGCNPWTSADAKIVDLLDGIPLVRLTPLDGPLVASPDDPGGRAWVWRQAVVLVSLIALARAVAVLRRVARRRPTTPGGHQGGPSRDPGRG